MEPPAKIIKIKFEEWEMRRKLKKECSHDKLFTPVNLVSYPTKFQWICRKCKKEGNAIGIVIDECYYKKIKELFKNEPVEDWE